MPHTEQSKPKASIAWEAPEFEYRRKDVSWYWLTIIAAVILVAAAVWQRNFLFGVFVVIAELLLLAWGYREPRALSFALTEKGVTVGEHDRIAFEEIADFGVEEREGSEWATLVVRFRRRLRPTVKLKVPVGRLTLVRKALKLFVPEVRIEKTLADTLEDFIGF